MDFSIPHFLLVFQQVAVVNLPAFFSVHVPIKPYTQISAVQTIRKDWITNWIGQERFLVTGRFVAPLLFRVGSAETILREYHNASQPLLVAFGLVPVVVVKLPHSLTKFAPSNFLHVVYSFSILNCCCPLRTLI